MEYLIEKKNGKNDTIKLNENIFNLNKNETLIHQLVTSYISNSHNGIKKHKSRNEVSGGGKKPWRQKGTGRARAGSIRSPLWKGGGKIFAAKGIPSRFKKINKKIYKKGIKIILSQLIIDKRIKIIDEIIVQNKKTKTFLKEVNYLENIDNSLFILNEIDLNTNLAARNLNKINIISYKKINPIVLLKYKKIFITVSGIKALEEHLK